MLPVEIFMSTNDKLLGMHADTGMQPTAKARDVILKLAQNLQ